MKASILRWLYHFGLTNARFNADLTPLITVRFTVEEIMTLNRSLVGSLAFATISVNKFDMGEASLACYKGRVEGLLEKLDKASDLAEK